jgi:ankyrin repeat protein
MKKYILVTFLILFLLVGVTGTSVLVVHGASYEIFIAANKGDLKMAKGVLSKDPDSANLKSKGGFTPIHLASANGHVKVVKLLIEGGAELNARNQDGATPMIKAVQGKHLEVVEMLIREGADVNLQDDTGNNPLLLALDESIPEIAAILIPIAKMKVKTKGGSTPLHMAVSRETGSVGPLLERGVPVNAQDNRGWTALHMAASSGDSETVSLLLEKGADPTIKNKREETPFMIAVRKNRPEIIDLLK